MCVCMFLCIHIYMFVCIIRFIIIKLLKQTRIVQFPPIFLFFCFSTYLFNYNVFDFSSLLTWFSTGYVTHTFLVGCVWSPSTGSERAGHTVSIWRPTCPLLISSRLFQAVPAGGVAWRPRRSALRAQRDQGLHLRPRQRIHRREQDPGRRSGDGPEDPAGCRPLTCERRQLKGVGVGGGGGQRGRRPATRRFPVALGH